MTTIQQQMTDLIVRTDPTLDVAPAPESAAAPSSPFSTVRLLVLSQWTGAAPGPATLATMTCVLDHFLAALLEAGITDLDDADKRARRFVEAAPTVPAWHTLAALDSKDLIHLQGDKYLLTHLGERDVEHRKLLEPR